MLIKFTETSAMSIVGTVPGDAQYFLFSDKKQDVSAEQLQAKTMISHTKDGEMYKIIFQLVVVAKITHFFILAITCESEPPCTSPGFVNASQNDIKETVVFLPFKATGVSRTTELLFF